MKTSKNPLIKLLVKARMTWAGIRGHHGKGWDYEPGENYLGMKKSNYWKRNHKVK